MENTVTLLRPSEVAERLQLCKNSVYALIAERQLPSVRIGRAVRVSTRDLEAFVEARKAGASSAQ